MRKETAIRINRAAERLSKTSATVSKRLETERAKDYVRHSNELDADIRTPRQRADSGTRSVSATERQHS